MSPESEENVENSDQKKEKGNENVGYIENQGAYLCTYILYTTLYLIYTT